MRATETDALMMMRRGGTLVDAEASTASRGNDESGGIGKSFRKYSDVDEEVGEEEENERSSRKRRTRKPIEDDAKSNAKWLAGLTSSVVSLTMLATC